MIVNAAPCSCGGGATGSDDRPQISLTSSSTTYDKPKVISSSGTWPNLCTRRKAVRSNSAPSSPTASGASTSATQNPNNEVSA